MAAPDLPVLAAPVSGRVLEGLVPALDRQHKALGLVEPGIEHPRHPRALFRIGQFGVGRIDIGRQRRFLLQPMRGVFERGQHVVGRRARAFARCLRQNVRRRRFRPCADFRCSRSGRRSSRSARRPCANRARTPSAAGFRPDTICPARNAAGRRARNARAVCGSGRRRARAWSDRPRRYSIPAIPDRRPKRRSARRPSSAARRPSSDRHRPASPSLSSRDQDSSENGRVIRGASRMRLTLISKPNSTLAKPALPEIGAAER